MNGDEGNAQTGGQVVTSGDATAPVEPLVDASTRANPVYAPPGNDNATAPIGSFNGVQDAPPAALGVAPSAAPNVTTPQQTPASPTSPAYYQQGPLPAALPNQDMELPAEDFTPTYDETGKDAFGQRDPTIVEWRANEFIQHHKSIKWYAATVGGFVVAAIIAFFLTKDKFTAGTLVVIGIMFAILGARKPRELSYRLDADGLKMGTDKEYPFSLFRSFALMEEHDTQSVSFYPLQRFMPLITVYFDSSDEDRIVQMLSNHLPMEERTHDAIDRFLHKIKL